MGPTAAQIRKGFEELAKKHGPAVSNIAQVKSVDETKGTCILLDEDGQEFFDVRLRPVLNGNKSIMILPKVSSYVLAVRVEDDDDWMIIGYDEIDKIGYYVGDVIFEINDGFLLKKENETLQKLMADLITAIKSMSFTTNTGVTISLVNIEDFTNIEDRFNTFLK